MHLRRGLACRGLVVGSCAHGRGGADACGLGSSARRAVGGLLGRPPAATPGWPDRRGVFLGAGGRLLEPAPRRGRRPPAGRRAVARAVAPAGDNHRLAVTTIAWRLVHVGAGCFANRASTFFGDGSVPDSADKAIAFLERTYRQWHTGISSLDEEGLRTPLGRKGGRYAKDPMAALIVHINREVMHHGAEIGLLRDLYRATGSTTRDSRLLPQA